MNFTESFIKARRNYSTTLQKYQPHFSSRIPILLFLFQEFYFLFPCFHKICQEQALFRFLPLVFLYALFVLLLLYFLYFLFALPATLFCFFLIFSLSSFKISQSLSASQIEQKRSGEEMT